MNHLIEEQSQLTDIEPLFKQLSDQEGVVAVDTEFLREKTYNAKLCLVQLGIGEHQYCIDVLAINDLSSLAALFADEKVLKLFHAARQDMEVILQTLEVLPKPIFDTQLAAAFCGLDMQIGYGGLVSAKLGIDLPKTQSRTDWTRRPLSSEQIEYAGDDVAHLQALYENALQELEQAAKRAWYDAEIETYYNSDIYIIDPAKAYTRLAGGSLRVKQQYALKALAEWREATAQKRDIPRSWVLRDDKLFDLAAKLPSKVDEVIEMGVFGRKSAQYLAPQAVQILSNFEVGDERVWRKVEPLSKPEKSICSTMMKMLANLAEKYEVAQALLGTRRDIESLFRNRSSKKLLQGWREDIVGQPLIDYLRSEKV